MNIRENGKFKFKYMINEAHKWQNTLINKFTKLYKYILHFYRFVIRCNWHAFIPICMQNLYVMIYVFVINFIIHYIIKNIYALPKKCIFLKFRLHYRVDDRPIQNSNFDAWTLHFWKLMVDVYFVNTDVLKMKPSVIF